MMKKLNFLIFIFFATICIAQNKPVYVGNNAVSADAQILSLNDRDLVLSKNGGTVTFTGWDNNENDDVLIATDQTITGKKIFDNITSVDTILQIGRTTAQDRIGGAIRFAATNYDPNDTEIPIGAGFYMYGNENRWPVWDFQWGSNDEKYVFRPNFGPIVYAPIELTLPNESGQLALLSDISSNGNGDMIKSVYDSNDDGKVDAVDAANVDVSYSPSNYTPNASSLEDHLEAIDAVIPSASGNYLGNMVYEPMSAIEDSGTSPTQNGGGEIKRRVGYSFGSSSFLVSLDGNHMVGVPYMYYVACDDSEIVLSPANATINVTISGQPEVSANNTFTVDQNGTYVFLNHLGNGSYNIASSSGTASQTVFVTNLYNQDDAATPSPNEVNRVGPNWGNSQGSLTSVSGGHDGSHALRIERVSGQSFSSCVIDGLTPGQQVTFSCYMRAEGSNNFGLKIDGTYLTGGNIYLGTSGNTAWTEYTTTFTPSGTSVRWEMFANLSGGSIGDAGQIDNIQMTQ